MNPFSFLQKDKYMSRKIIFSYIEPSGYLAYNLINGTYQVTIFIDSES